VTPHQMRHTAIALVNDTTGDLRTAQVFARHRRIESTQIYTRTTAEKLEHAMEALDYV
jgi:site-specific recombinase XerC